MKASNKFHKGDRVRNIVNGWTATVRVVKIDMIGLELDFPVPGGHDLDELVPPGSETGWWGTPSIWEVIGSESDPEDAELAVPNLSAILGGV